VLAEKGVAVEIVESEHGLKPTELADINPYNSLPTLLDRDLVLYEPNIMMEYLDERFPHPPLLPVYPVARAESRLLIHRIEKDWGVLVNEILNGRGNHDKQRLELEESITSVAGIFAEKPYFMSETFSVVDCTVAPILWRLPKMGIELSPKKVKPLFEYMDRLFDREGFQASLSEAEREMRD
jgi:RNA polymerase-associated protein